MILSEPWYDLTEREPFAQQLKKEIRSGHKLAGLSFEVIGKNGANDDVLIKIGHITYQLAVVNLVWNGRTDHQYPLTHFYIDWQDFVDNRMKEDNFGYFE